MDSERIKRLFPFLKNVDLDNPQTRRNVIMIAVAGALFLLLIFASLAKKGSSEAPEDEAAQAPVSTLEITQGEANDALSAESAMDVRDRRRQRTDRSLEDIFSSSPADEDPMKFLTEDASGTASATGGVDLTSLEDILSGKELAETPQGEGSSSFGQDLFPGETPMGGKAKGTRTEQPRKGRASSSSDDGRPTLTAQQRAEQRKRQLMMDAGLDPDTGQPLNQGSSSSPSSSRSGGGGGSSYSSGGSSFDALGEEEPQAGVTSAPEPPAASQAQPKVSVRKSGEISSLGANKGRSSVGGLGSLKNRDVYVSEDDAHLFKVMFARSEKVSNGQRVTLRLLEDMVVDGNLIPSNTFIAAIVTTGDRLNVTVSSIELNGKIYPLNYEGYDTDGSKGLYCPRSEKQQTSDELEREGRQLGRTLLGSRITGTAGLAVSAGASIIENTRGQQTITVTQGYTFFLRQKKTNY